MLEFLTKGGLEICLNYINGPLLPLRIKACSLVAEVSQNNPSAQDMAFKCGLLPSLLNLTDTEKELKSAMSAISAIVRGHEEAFMFFAHNGGQQFILKGLQAESEDTVKKFAFFLISGYANCPDERSDLRAVGVVPMLLRKIDEAVKEKQEILLGFLLEALINMMDDDNKAFEECQSPQNKLRQNLRICKEIYPAEEFSNVTDHADKLINTLFNGTVEDETSIEHSAST
ncbi:hypothetical protein LSTR_LSTR009785 [Laodelphax striatellus]|uniref:Nucleotide exchange factor Fes1 domain-containing protein n=1 Tax=Laodelphax striatellus TaxID=195883 RepID=A0A482XNW0_LAOST|nr:hypothetical protein LSTR_LSTR009785 [Laodelphax striatellus]